MTRSLQQPLWTPSPERVAATQLTAFMHDLATTEDFNAGADYFALHRWSLEQPAAFWRAVWRFTEVQGTPGDSVCDDP